MSNEPLLPMSPPSPLKGVGLDLGSSNTKIIVVHHWSEYDEGTHKIHEIEITGSNRVLDVIMLSVAQFYTSGADPSNFNLRLADKSGKPKTSMPVLDINQGIMQIGVVRFALCSKGQDVKRSEKFDKYEETTSSTSDPPKNVKITENIKGSPQSMEQRTSVKIKKKICCCFTSD
ncbi:hypothetical protein SteCoe_19465 [Stentor coeruleus]|uniref:Uncharacterized protein n=1 Tax=Stentor coeruleus TaxID=5963 RepID=A0A1R2BUE2_9CILI|nr:hypothetical protein SteCoe_19465 [Stentor coeruleus]